MTKVCEISDVKNLENGWAHALLHELLTYCILRNIHCVSRKNLHPPHKTVARNSGGRS